LIADIKEILHTLGQKETEVRTNTGKWYSMRIRPYRTVDNVIEGAVISFIDITEAKLAKEALAVSELRFRRLFETAQDGILTLDANTGEITGVNQFLINLLGYSEEQFIMKKIWDLGFFKDVIENKQKFEELLAKEYVRYDNLPLETAEGRQIDVEFISNVYKVNESKVIQCAIRMNKQEEG
jgi:two-component system CheB/CheR fusion protein